MIIPSPSKEAYRLTRQMRAVRNFRPEALAPDVVEDIVQAARWTGSAKNRQPWSLVIVEGEAERKRLGECGRFTGPILNAPLAIALVRSPDGYDFDMGRLAQNLMLAAAAVGVGSCPVTLQDEDCVRARLGIPEDHTCRFAVVLGYPDQEAERRAMGRRTYQTGRRPLAEVVHWGRFSS